MSTSAVAIDYRNLPEPDLVRRAQAGERDAFRFIMQRCNQRLFRVARSILQDETEAEDALQDAYLLAFRKLESFRGDSSLLTWLTRITINEARGRLRRRRNTVGLEILDATPPQQAQVIMFPTVTSLPDPEGAAAQAEMRRLIERALDALPEPFRLVFIMREVEDCSIEETAASLALKPETVKTRLHRARRLLRKALDEELRAPIRESFPFLGSRCEGLTERVLRRLASNER
jgi:RNA polymerase sigma-70 factor (ECF subfamily)